MSEPCSALLLWRLGVREGPRLAGRSSAGAGAGAEEGVVGLLLGRLPCLLLPRLPDPALAFSPFQAPGPSKLGSSRVAASSAGQGEGVRVRRGAEPGRRWSIGLSGGVGGRSSASCGSCNMGSAFSLFSAISCSARFFRYSGPMEKT